MSKPLGIGAFDIDGTILHHDEKPDYLSPASLKLAKPDAPLCTRVRNLIEAGLDIHFITGRSHAVRMATMEQLNDLISPKIHFTNLHTQGEFIDYETMKRWKAATLRSVGAQWFVGDHEADEQAALLAGIPFQYAATYSRTCALAVA